MDSKKFGCKAEFEMEDEKIAIKDRKYGILQLQILSLVIRFLGLMLGIMGLMRSVQYGDARGWIYVVIAVVIFMVGMTYKNVVVSAKATQAEKQ